MNMQFVKQSVIRNLLLVMATGSVFFLGACGDNDTRISSAVPVVIRKKMPAPLVQERKVLPPVVALAMALPVERTPPVADTLYPAPEKQTDNIQKKNSVQKKPATPMADTLLTQLSYMKKATGSSGKYTVQVGAFKNPKNCEMFAVKLKSKGYNSYIISVPQGSSLWHVVKIGRYNQKKDAFAEMDRFMKKEGATALVTYAGTVRNAYRNLSTP